MTLYFDVELSNDKRPGTEQNTSAGVETMANPSLLLMSLARIPKNVSSKWLMKNGDWVFLISSKIRTIKSLNIYHQSIKVLRVNMKIFSEYIGNKIFSFLNNI